ncbi:hypothetical protein Aple_075380 [Acrocarpospora pleiomorpha]|uniref:HTH iclR-type domain-containing protein n=1 Tax=Acrocarpospora pleiomorpha TaxID=90975 RepID=A0A5M3XX41_9ACTN|nr:helix-turn-helix domain-containing protein [Acrocarpospora pleiomorpha]GES24639.1 hypothetical protein Aple_075380 [Acrocarpospora pleiomorpha]
MGLATQVPAVDRAKVVLDLLAEDPLRAYRAAEVAKLTGMHRASCFSLLGALAEAGMVTRDPEGPRYSLGPLLIRYGSKSAGGHVGFGEARREMFRLADELGYGCMVSGRIGYETVTLDSVGVDESGFPGGRSPIRAPRGTIFLAWSSATDLDVWLEWSGVSSDGEERRAFTRTAAAIRARGYSLGADVELGLSLERMARHLSEEQDAEDLDDAMYQLAGLLRRSGSTAPEGGSPAESVHFITAPVFDRLGTVTVALTLVSGSDPFPVDKVQALADRVVTGAAQVSRILRG